VHISVVINVNNGSVTVTDRMNLIMLNMRAQNDSIQVA